MALKQRLEVKLVRLRRVGIGRGAASVLSMASGFFSPGLHFLPTVKHAAPSPPLPTWAQGMAVSAEDMQGERGT